MVVSVENHISEFTKTGLSHAYVCTCVMFVSARYAAPYHLASNLHETNGNPTPSRVKFHVKIIFQDNIRHVPLT